MADSADSIDDIDAAPSTDGPAVLLCAHQYSDSVACYNISRPTRLLVKDALDELCVWKTSAALPRPARVVKVTDEAVAVSSGDAGTIGVSPIWIFRPLTGELLATLHSPRGCHIHTYGLDGISDRLLLAADHGGHSMIWDIEKEDVVHPVPDPPESTVVARCVQEWDCACYLGGRDCDIRVYDLAKGGISLAGRMIGHTGFVNGLAENLEKEVMYSVGGDKAAKIWSRRDPYSQVGSFPSKLYQCSCYFAQDLSLLLMGSSVGEVEVWDVRSSSKAVNMFKLVDELPGGLFGGFARVGPKIFVAASNVSISSFRLGTASPELVHQKNTSSYGIATLGTEYDHPQRTEERSLIEEEEPLHYLLSQREIMDDVIRPTLVSLVGTSTRLVVFRVFGQE